MWPVVFSTAIRDDDYHRAIRLLLFHAARALIIARDNASIGRLANAHSQVNGEPSLHVRADHVGDALNDIIINWTVQLDRALRNGDNAECDILFCPFFAK